MIVTPKENRTFLSINFEKYKKMEGELLSSCEAGSDDSNRKIPVVSTLDEMTEIQDASNRRKIAKEKAYESFRDQFLKINDFVQSSEDANRRNILHGYCKKSLDNEGNEQEEIIIYTRPRSANLITRFFDWVLYSEQEDFAQKFLLRFLASAPTMKPSDLSESQETENQIKKLSECAAVWINSMKGIGQHALAKKNLSIVKNSSKHFLEAAKQLRNEIKEEMEERERKNRIMLNCIALEDQFFQWKPNHENTEIERSHNEISKLPEELKNFGSEKIKRFEDFLKDIKELSLGPASAERTSEFSAFCATWVSCFNKKDKQGDEFRNAINRSSQLRAWNVAAHYIALRDHPYIIEKEANPHTIVIAPEEASPRYYAPFNPAMMNLQHYKDSAYIMISALNEIYCKKRDEQTAIRETNNVDEKNPQGYKSIQFNNQVLKSFRPLNIIEDFNPKQEAELFSAYQEFIKTAAKENQEIVLTPIFNYTENTIDRCIDAMIKPIVTQRAIGAELPEIRFFSSDPRITEKFNLAIAEPENYMKSKADKAAQAARVTKAAPNHGLSQLQFQYGIAPRDMKDPGMIMLHASALKYGEIGGTAKILGGFTKKPLFAAAASTGTAVPRKIKPKLVADGPQMQRSANTTNQTKPASLAMGEKEVMSTTHFIMPTVELNLDPSYYQTLSNLLGLETLSSEQEDTIRQIFIQVFKNAKEKVISNLVLIPCFDLKQRASLQEQACAVMVDVLDKLIVSHPGIAVKMALASQEEYGFLQQQIARWEKAGNESRRRGI
jgi:hypothetical protein